MYRSGSSRPIRNAAALNQSALQIQFHNSKEVSMIRTFLVAALALVCLSLPAEAHPRHVAHHRYDPACNVSMPCEIPAGAKQVASRKEAARLARGQALYDAMPFGMPTDRAGRALPASQVIGGRPAGCPHRFCGCGASLYRFGKIIPSLNLAENWLRKFRHVPHSMAQPRMAAARRGHVMVLVEHIHGNVWLVHDSNSGGGRTRLHARSIAGFTVVDPNGAV
jgi:hypothetical protein